MTIKSRAKTGRTEQLNIRVTPELKKAILEISKRDAPEGRIQKPIGEVLSEALVLYEAVYTKKQIYKRDKLQYYENPYSLIIRIYKMLDKYDRTSFFRHLQHEGDAIANKFLITFRFKTRTPKKTVGELSRE